MTGTRDQALQAQAGTWVGVLMREASIKQGFSGSYSIQGKPTELQMSRGGTHVVVSVHNNPSRPYRRQYYCLMNITSPQAAKREVDHMLAMEMLAE